MPRKRKTNSGPIAKETEPMTTNGELTQAPEKRRNHPKSTGKPTKLAFHVLAQSTGTDRVLTAALKAQYGWTDETKLTRREFLQKRDAWKTMEV